MVGHPSLDVIPKPILFGAIPLGLAANGAALGTVFASTNIVHNYISGAETDFNKDVLAPIMISAEIGFTAGFWIIGEHSFSGEW